VILIVAILWVIILLIAIVINVIIGNWLGAIIALIGIIFIYMVYDD